MLIGAFCGKVVKLSALCFLEDVFNTQYNGITQ